MDLPIDYGRTVQAIFRKKIVRNSVIASAVLLNFSPLFLKDCLNREAKLALSLAGLGFAFACSRLPETEFEEKLKKTYEQSETKVLKTQIEAKLTELNTVEQINGKIALAKFVENLPQSYQTEYFAQALGLAPLIAQYYIEQSEELQQPINQTVTVSASVFDAQLDAKQDTTDSDIGWLKLAVLESCFIAGKKNSGKSHLMKWLLGAWIEQATEKDLFYVIDPHLDDDEPWLVGMSENVIKARFYDASRAIEMIKQLHDCLLNRIKNKDFLKVTNSRVRVFLDEIDSYKSENLETVIAPFIRDVENQGRKYGFTVVIGAHSIKKGEMGIDSSITGAMLQVLFPSVLLDKNSVLSGAFPGLPIIRNQIDRYKGEYKDCRCVAILENGETFYISHVPTLELPQFKLQQPTFEVELPQEPPQNTKSKTISPYDFIVLWCQTTFKNDGCYPNQALIKHAWEHETGKVLNDDGLQLLIDYLAKHGIVI